MPQSPTPSRQIEAQVAIVGAGPVGLTLALDLAWRGIDVAVAEIRHAHEPPSVKCGQISARSMEIFRRLGLSDTLRELGLPADFPNDIVSRTTATGLELARVPLPSRGARRRPDAVGADTWWPTPEHAHRVNQIFFEPVLSAQAAAHPRIRLLNRTMVEDFAETADGVTVTARDLDDDTRTQISARFLVGCDGARSMVRKGIGATLDGTPVIQRVQSTRIRAPELLARMSGKPAWLNYSLNPRRCGALLAIDGKEQWLIHNFLYRDEADFETVDRDWAIRAILGVGPDFPYEVMSKEDWVGRRLVADKFREGRVLICGDAGHLWIPHGGYGMNAGIADAADLAWMLAATLRGWAPADILTAYDAERRPITDQASRIIANIAQRIIAQRRGITAEIEAEGPAGDAARARIGDEAHVLDIEQQCCGGLNFGYFYADSPIIAYDGETAPAYTMHEFTPSTVPGCRTPHLWLDGRRSLYDELGPDFSLIRTDPAAPAGDLVMAAKKRGVPLRVLDVDPAVAQPVYGHKLVLVRPDQHVAWRGDAAPPDALGLIDLVRGAAA